MSQCYIQNIVQTAPCKCDDCNHECPASELEMITDIEIRLTAGSEVPAGECPKCFSLSYLITST
jgi:hypothetical protein